MKKRINIIFSTTRQWNPGDEFILLGCINLLKENLTLDFNPLIYNRNPQIQVVVKNKYHYFNYFLSLFGVNFNKIYNFHFDNSVSSRLDANIVDIVVFAGSPSWYGPRHKLLYNICTEKNIQVCYMGIGLGEHKKISTFSKLELSIIQKARFIIVRDEKTKLLLENYEAKYLPCPALFSSKTHKIVKKVETIGLIFATYETLQFNNIKKGTWEFLRKLYFRLLTEYKLKFRFEFIAHHIDEIQFFNNEFEGYTINYSYDSKDYLDIYNKFDLVIGSRIHGIGIAASLGIPGILVANDIRSQVADGFNAIVINNQIEIEDAMLIINNLINKIGEKSLQIINNKTLAKEQYKNIIISRLLL